MDYFTYKVLLSCEKVLQRLDNVAFVVEDWPDAETLRLADLKRQSDLLGFYHGVPLTRRTRGQASCAA